MVECNSTNLPKLVAAGRLLNILQKKKIKVLCLIKARGTYGHNYGGARSIYIYYKNEATPKPLK